ncbi:MAG: glycosyltransferase family 39 protein [Dehalococcoidia bacterium]
MAIGVVAIGFVALSVPLLAQPFGRDQGIFATIADAISRGQLPYRDAWDHKPPGIDYAYALAFRLFGRSWTSVHLLELLAILAAMLGLWAMMRPTERLGAIAAAALLGAGSILQFEWWDRGQAEFLIASLSTLGLAALVAGRGARLGSALAGGVLLGALVWFKPTAVPIAAFGALVVLVRLGAGRRALIDLVAFGLGGALALGVPAALFAAAGVFDELWQAVVVFNQLHLQTGANLTFEAAAWATAEFAIRMGPLTALAAAGLVGARRRLGLTLLLAGWLVVALTGVWMQGKYFSYHWSVALPPLAGLAGLGLAEAWSAVRRPGPDAAFRRGTAVFLAIVLILPVVADQQAKLGRDLAHLLGRTSERDYYAQFAHNLNDVDVYSFNAARDTADYLRERTTSNDTVLVWGFQALVNWLADRPSPTRYVFSYPLTIGRPDSAPRREARETFLHEFDAARPAYVVLVSKDVNPIQPVDSVTLLDGFPALKARLDRDYVKERDIAEFQIFRRK